MVVDPVLVAAETIARIQHRRMLVGGPRQFVQPAAGQRAEAIEMRLKPPKIARLQIKPEQIAQAAIDRIKILPGAIRRQMDRRRDRDLARHRTIWERQARACLDLTPVRLTGEMARGSR